MANLQNHQSKIKEYLQSTRPDEFRFVQKCLQFGCNFYLYGPTGIGKTRFLDQIFEINGINLFHTKQNILKEISHQVLKLLKFECFRETSKFQQFMQEFYETDLMLNWQNAKEKSMLINPSFSLKCYCQTEYNDRMINCNNCDKWIHLNCIGFKKNQDLKKLDFKCIDCIKQIDNIKYKDDLLDQYKKIFSYRYFNYDMSNISQIKIYILLDNVEKLDISDKLFSAFLSLNNFKQFKIIFIFCGLGINSQITENNYQFSLLPKICLSKLKKEHALKIIKDHLKKKFIYLNNKKLIDDVSFDYEENLAKDIFQSFDYITYNLNTFMRLANQLYLLAYDQVIQQNNYQRIDDKMFQEQPHKIFTKKNVLYFEAKKFFMVNPFINESNLENLRKRINYEKNACNDKNKSIMTRIQKLPLICQFLLVACFIGNRNPALTDKKFFKDYRKIQSKGKKGIKDDVGLQICSKDHKIKKTEVNRLISLTQSLMSTQTDMDALQQEINLWDQSADFYLHINYLQEMFMIIKFTDKSNELLKQKFLCNVDQFVIEDICSDLKMNLHEFLIQ